MRYIIVPIEAEEKDCGGCGHLDYYACRKFFTNGHFTGLASPDGKPLRCPACLSAEAKYKRLIEVADEVETSECECIQDVCIHDRAREALADYEGDGER